MLLEKINSYEIFRPKCDSTKEVLHSIATFDAPIKIDSCYGVAVITVSTCLIISRAWTEGLLVG
jgi:hypothetical protein